MFTRRYFLHGGGQLRIGGEKNKKERQPEDEVDFEAREYLDKENKVR
jgi:hypothetical protein